MCTDGGSGNIKHLAGDAEKCARHFSFFHQLTGDILRRVDRDRKTNPLRPGNYRSIDPDNFRTGIDERAAGVAGVQRCICLNNIVDQSSSTDP